MLNVTTMDLGIAFQYYQPTDAVLRRAEEKW